MAAAVAEVSDVRPLPRAPVVVLLLGPGSPMPAPPRPPVGSATGVEVGGALGGSLTLRVGQRQAVSGRGRKRQAEAGRDVVWYLVGGMWCGDPTCSLPPPPLCLSPTLS